jgi:hypothetical protein
MAASLGRPNSVPREGKTPCRPADALGDIDAARPLEALAQLATSLRSCPLNGHADSSEEDAEGAALGAASGRAHGWR